MTQQPHPRWLSQISVTKKYQFMAGQASPQHLLNTLGLSYCFPSGSVAMSPMTSKS